MSRRDTGLIASFINWITGTGRTVRHTTTFWGCPKVEVTDYDRGYRTVRIRKQGFFGNRNSYRRVMADRHFENVADGGFHLTAEGRGIVFRAFDEMMVRRVAAEGGRVTIRQFIDTEVCRFIGMLEGREPIRFHHAA